jgi:uncharacterized protein YecE (DUF72 family)
VISRGYLHVPGIVVGVDTHKDEHVAVVIDKLGVRIGQHNLPTTNTGYVDLEHWASSLGEIDAFGVEGTGSYGAGLARFLRGRGHKVIEVNRPDRSTRRRLGKSDPTDAEMAARAGRDGCPDGFLFTVKLWQKFTHPKMFEKATGDIAAISQDDISLFRQGIEPLVRAGKLGALLAQFPPSFTNDGYGKQMLQALITHFGEYHLVVELRHKSWSDDPATAKLLQEGKAAWVQIDEPKFSFSLADNVPQTSDLAYFRFHGRNKDMWWKGDVETRYCYLYSADEIKELAEKVMTTSANSGSSFVFFNNHWRAYAPRNAVDMMKALQLPFPGVPLFQKPLRAEE